MSGDRGSIAGIELLTRTSLNALKDSIDIPMNAPNARVPVDERNWSWSYLRQQFQLKNLESLYQMYVSVLKRGYFFTYLITQTIIISAYTGIVLMVHEETNNVLSLCFTVAINLITLALNWFLLIAFVYKKEYNCIISLVSILLVMVPDLWFMMIHDEHSQKFKPALCTHVVLIIYIFLPLLSHYQATLIGICASNIYVFVSMNNSKGVLQKIDSNVISEIIYMICINGFGLYYRFMSEIILRRTFLDRRACVESTLRLKYEKEQEEILLSNILPKHIASLVKKDLWNVFQHIKLNHNEPLKKKPFSALYIEEHKMVSILYADVVNYSQLTECLPASKLVKTLNLLFTKFDEASEARNILRIKFLGDCYNCVCGIPEGNPDHAKNCVEFGLDMISIIKEIREIHQIPVDMRIGVHSGRLFSGLLGVCKWQYDIWSEDVVIANHMEQTGKPGMVHITDRTLSFLNDEYTVEPNPESENSQQFAKLSMKTYFIKSRNENDSIAENPFFSYQKRRSTQVFKCNLIKQIICSKGSDPILRRRTTFMDNNLILYQEMLKKADVAILEAIKQLPMGNKKFWKNFQWICLRINGYGLSSIFYDIPDPIFKFYILAFSAIFFVTLLLLRFKFSTFWMCSLNITLIVIAILCSWFHFIWIIINDPFQELEEHEPKWWIIRMLYRCSLKIVWSNFTRTSMFICLNLLFTTIMFQIDLTSDAVCLIMLSCFVFFRIYYYLKLLLSCILLSFLLIMIKWKYYTFTTNETWYEYLAPQTATFITLVSLTFLLHMADRQMEYISRLDFCWKKQLAQDLEEASTTRMINNMLLHNILPVHTAEYYLNISRPYEKLHYEEHPSVAVMFATLTDITEVQECNQLISLEMLNQIICNFDKLLFETNFSTVEKIKVAGWTYMAASGLESRKKETSKSTQTNNNSHALIILQFASNMFRVLQKFNQHSDHKFDLTVGISYGTVVAGVVGTQKPLYDIWGDTVNMAARMDSTGKLGTVHISKETKDVLERNGVRCVEKGATFIKGKNWLTTYFVDELAVQELYIDC